MTTYNLKLTPAGGPVTEKRGLTREQALWALTDLVYGPFDEDEKAPAQSLTEEHQPIAA